MLEEQVKASILCALRHGTIQEFQIESQLRLKGVSSFQCEKMKKEILEKFHKEHPCY